MTLQMISCFDEERQNHNPLDDSESRHKSLQLIQDSGFNTLRVSNILMGNNLSVTCIFLFFFFVDQEKQFYILRRLHNENIYQNFFLISTWMLNTHEDLLEYRVTLLPWKKLKVLQGPKCLTTWSFTRIPCNAHALKKIKVLQGLEYLTNLKLY